MILYGNVYDVILIPPSFLFDLHQRNMQNVRSQISSHGIQEVARLYVTFFSASMFEAFNNTQILGLAGQNATEEYDAYLLHLYSSGNL